MTSLASSLQLRDEDSAILRSHKKVLSAVFDVGRAEIQAALKLLRSSVSVEIYNTLPRNRRA